MTRARPAKGAWALWALLVIGVARGAPAEDSGLFTVPPELETDVRFWVRVYAEVTTDQGLLHDSWYLGLVYEVLRFAADTPLSARERQIATAKAHYTKLLRRFAAGDTEDLTPHERRILRAFGENPRPQQFLDAIERIRFQLGQADRFREGLIRAGAWEGRMAKTLRERGVPPELAALPHVESSFNPAAYSRVGAAGLWQFMPSTARRFMRVDALVDERLDPERATEAAANLMLYNYNLVGSWPLAVTAYNHGPGGLRRAQNELGTNDIAVIVKRFQGATFGFASRNFYVSFLAALEVDRNAETFFGPLPRQAPPVSTAVEVPDFVPAEALAKAFRVDAGALRAANPALRPPIWDAERFVPRGVQVHIPGTISAAEVTASLARLPPSQRYLAQRGDATHRLRRGETVNVVAARFGVPVPRLLAANGWTTAPTLQRGQVLHLPLPLSRADTSAPDPRAAAPATAPVPAPAPAPVAVPEATGSAVALPDTTDYSIGPGNTVIVLPDETLGHFADWSGVDSDALRKQNHLAKGSRLGLGQKLKIELGRVTAAQFAAARSAYHRQLQESFFSGFRISGTETYRVRQGDSVWNIAQAHPGLPLWLITQYNPDVDFSDMHPGTQITLPRIAVINRE